MLSTLRRLLAFLLGVGLAVFALNELAEHVCSMGSLEVDPDFGFVRDNSQAVFRLEGSGVSHWLARGVRDNGNGLVPGPRVLVLGDSQTEALQVNDTETFVSVAERGLRQQGFAVNLLNCGYASRSVADFVKLAPAFRREFRPDWTVIVVHEVDFGLDAWNLSKAHFEKASDGSIRLSSLPPDPEPTSRGPIPRPPRGWQWCRQKLRLFPTHRLCERRANAFGKRWALQPPLFCAGQTPAPADPQREYPIGEVAEILVDAYGPRLTLVLRRNFWGRAKAYPPTPGQLQIEDVCRRHGIRMIDLASGYPELAALGRAPYGFPNTTWNTGHLNATGHAWIGRRLEREIKDLRQHGVL